MEPRALIRKETSVDFSLTSGQDAIREVDREFALGEVDPLVEEIDESQHFPKEVMKKAGELGFLGILFPEELGGAGLGYVEYVLVVTDLSKVGPSVGISVAAHNSLCTNHIYKFGLGTAMSAFDTARAYAKEREQFGRPIARFQAIQSPLAEISMRSDRGVQNPRRLRLPHRLPRREVLPGHEGLHDLRRHERDPESRDRPSDPAVGYIGAAEEVYRDDRPPLTGEIYATGLSEKDVVSFASRLYMALEDEADIEKVEPRRHYRIGGAIDLRFSLLHLTLPHDLHEHVLAASALGKLLVDKKYFADELTQLYIDHGFFVLVTAAAIGIDAVDFHTHDNLEEELAEGLTDLDSFLWERTPVPTYENLEVGFECHIELLESLGGSSPVAKLLKKRTRHPCLVFGDVSSDPNGRRHHRASLHDVRGQSK